MVAWEVPPRLPSSDWLRPAWRRASRSVAGTSISGMVTISRRICATVAAAPLACSAMAPLGRTGLDVFGLCLGGNVFGWTADDARSREVLDAYAAAGGNFIDTANSYLVEHGRSETII